LKSIREKRQIASLNFKAPFYFIIDVETNGLPVNYNAPVSNSNNWPHVIEIGWVLFDSEENIILKKSIFINPEGYIINEDILNLTNRHKRIKKGNIDSISNALKDLERWIECADYIIGHNVEFDVTCLAAEYHRLKIKSAISEKQTVCLMKQSVNFCQIDGGRGYKYPKLEELYWKLFNRKPAEVHGADLDAMITAECFWNLKKRGVLTIS